MARGHRDMDNPYFPSSIPSDATSSRSITSILAVAIAKRVSLIYALGAVLGIIGGLMCRVGIAKALSELMSIGAIVFCAFYALIAAIASVVYKPRDLKKEYRAVRLAGGLTFGLTLMLFEKLVDGYLCSRPAIFDSIEILISLTLITALCVSTTTQISINALLSNARRTQSKPSPG